MAFVDWQNEFSVGVGDIDDQHRLLLIMINDLHTAMTEGRGRELVQKTLEDMAEYAASHFATEERYMNRIGYRDFPEHQKEHEYFLGEVQKKQAEFLAGQPVLTIEVLLFLKEWLVDHILGTDKKFGAFYNQL